MHTNNYELKCAIEKHTEDLLIKTEHINKLLLPAQDIEALQMTTYAECNLSEFLNCQTETLSLIISEVDIASHYICGKPKYEELPQAECAIENDEGKAFEQIFDIKEMSYYIDRILLSVLEKLTDQPCNDCDCEEKMPVTINDKLNKILDIILDCVDTANDIIRYLEKEEIADPECEKTSVKE